MKTILASLFALASMLGVPGAAAQAYPVKPIRFLVGFPPGGGTDIMARVVTAKLTESVGQQVIRRQPAGGECQPGRGHCLAGDARRLHRADDFPGPCSEQAALQELDYDLERDFTPLINIASVPMFVVVPPASAVKSLAELLALARSKPINYASSGDGSPEHIAAELFKGLAKIDMTHVPYKGGAPSALALIAGEIQVGFNTAPVAVPHIRSGKMRALAVSSAKRNPALPEVPTVAEAGVPGYDIILWYGAVMPTGTPAAIVNRLNADINKALKLPDVQQRLAALGADPLGGTPAEFGAYTKAEVAKYTRVVREAKLQQQ